MPPIQPKLRQVATASAQTRYFLLLAILWYGFFAFTMWRNPDLFWDAKLYGQSVHTLQAGGNPYALRMQENFVYSPVFLKTAVLLSNLVSFHLLAVLYLLVHGAAVLAIPFVVARFYLQPSWFTPAIALLCFAFHPGLNGQIALLSGNVSSILYATVLLAGVPGIRRNKWSVFYLAIALGAIIKPQILSLLLLPVFAGESQLSLSLITALAVAAAKLIERVLWPVLYTAFLKAAFFQVVVLNDSGIGLVRYFVHYHLGENIPLLHRNVVYLVDIVLTGAMLIGLRTIRSKTPRTISPATWRAAILVAAILANPRMMPYEAAIAVMPATLLIMEGVMLFYHRGISPLLLLAPFALFAVLCLRSASPAVFCWLAASILLVILRDHEKLSAATSCVPSPPAR